MTHDFISHAIIALVAAGAITVPLMPPLTSITYRVADVQPIAAVREADRGQKER